MSWHFSISINTANIFSVLLLFAGAHVFKFGRFYLVLMEEKKLSFFDVFFLYVRTTLVNLIIPFKLGELYRVAAVKHMSGSFKTGILLVLIDRFFDTLALLTLTLPFGLIFLHEADPVLVLLFTCLIFLFVCFRFFEPSFSYVNRFLITTKKSGRALVLLNILDKADEWYQYLRRLIRGRSPLVFLSSLLGWIIEFGALKLFAGTLGTRFDIEAFIRYINSLLSGGTGNIGKAYNFMGIAVFAVLTLVCLAMNGGAIKRAQYERKGAGRK